MKRLTRRKQLKLDKKRKQAKQARKRSSHRDVSLAYHGKKYHTDELIPVYFQTELAIHECHVMTGGRLTDHDVRDALETLILQLRSGQLPEIDREKPLTIRPDHNGEAILWNIRSRWDRHFHSHPHPGRDKLVGVLRSTLGSIEIWGSPDPASRGYLKYIEGFCNRLGAQVHVFDSEEEMRHFLESGDESE